MSQETDVMIIELGLVQISLLWLNGHKLSSVVSCGSHGTAACRNSPHERTAMNAAGGEPHRHFKKMFFKSAILNPISPQHIRRRLLPVDHGGTKVMLEHA